MDLWGSLWGTGYSETSITTGNTITGTCYSSASARAMTARTINFTPFKRVLVDWSVSRGDVKNTINIGLLSKDMTRANKGYKKLNTYTKASRSTYSSRTTSGTLEMDVSSINEHCYFYMTGYWDPPEGDYPSGNWTFNNIRFLTN